MINSDLYQKELTKLFTQQNLENTTLTFENSGFSFFLHQSLNKEGISVVNVDVDADLKIWTKIMNEKGISLDFFEFLQCTLFHEIGHAKDETLLELKEVRFSSRRFMRKANDLEQFKEGYDSYVNAVLTCERNAWAYLDYFPELRKVTDVFSNSALNEYKESMPTLILNTVPFQNEALFEEQIKPYLNSLIESHSVTT